MAASRDCRCEACVGACSVMPGVFAPGEAERAAELLRLDFETFRKKYLVLEFWFDRSVSGGRVYGWRPSRVRPVDIPGGVASFSSAFDHGRCRLLTRAGRCRIHAAKPMECREAMCCEPAPSGKSWREKTFDLWKKAGNPLAEVDEPEED